ncbi:MAG: hypothetical protein KJ077_11010 [Anaerolineae bacterium]|nr:hypothetical protein [Anaerolineae bacterium]
MTTAADLKVLYGQARAALQSVLTGFQAAQAASQKLEVALKQYDPQRAAIDHLRRITEALRQYGPHSHLYIFRDGSGLIYASDSLGDFTYQLFEFSTLEKLFACDPAKWPTVEDVQRAWEVAKPTPRAGDYRDHKTWRNRFPEKRYA